MAMTVPAARVYVLAAGSLEDSGRAVVRDRQLQIVTGVKVTGHNAWRLSVYLQVIIVDVVGSEIWVSIRLGRVERE